MKIIVKDRQTLADLAIQELGGLSGLVHLAERNGLSITSELHDGMVLEYDATDVVSIRVVTQLSKQGVSPATEIDYEDYQLLLGATTPGGSFGSQLDPAGEEDNGIEIEKIDELLGLLASGKEPDSPTSEVWLTQVFDKTFDIVFA